MNERQSPSLSDVEPKQSFGSFSVRGVSMVFSGNTVLHGVDFECRPGEVHAIIGENGAGKSTLMKIMSGYLTPSAGTVLLNGVPQSFKNSKEAEAAGIVLVHQEILLVSQLTVAQNIFLGRELRRGFLVDDKAMNAAASKALEALGAFIAPDTPIELLSIANRQLVQIARALSGQHKFVICDEPTASLTPVECEALFNVIEKLKANGCGVIYISHKLDEVKRISDRVTVLRDGKWVATKDTAALRPIDMAHLMVGRDMSQLYPEKPLSTSNDVVMELQNVVVPGFVHGAGFELRRGEILGFFGLIGAGRTELFEGLMGLRKAQGKVMIEGEWQSFFHSAKQAFSHKIAYITEDRKGKGLLLDADLGTNLTLAQLSHFLTWGMISRTREQKALELAFSEFDIRAKSMNANAGQLSGGNQQKLLLAKMLLLEPAIIIVDEPTRGVDIGAKKQIYDVISALAAAGKSVIVVSSEMPELIGLCHRIVVMRQGKIAGEVERDEMTEQKIVALATGTDKIAA